MSDPGTTATSPPPTLEQLGDLLITEGKRLECYGLILKMPEAGLKEVLQVLSDVVEFYHARP